ncbi:hypothetical protein Acor_69180 [Acrocarpospora corrugata]|uniref:SCO6045-like C-terminal domain-containing protein n=1 Tax=Acrocarpospora corrugata TaxID=35763 RepID=A0A5M3W9E3_9ACTN|nr:hypothetical protein [Acrocarpospora corrugata]GES04850.1 hypothetical protein Acor_69180 [Acrocarpospora corrugata]
MIEESVGTAEVDATRERIEDSVDAARERLAREEARLLAALVAGAPQPPGFDPARLRIQAHSLIAKRRGLVAVALPGLVSALGAEFAREFFAYADGRPKPPGGSRADAHAFVEWLRAEGRLPAAPEQRRTSRWRGWLRKS